MPPLSRTITIHPRRAMSYGREIDGFSPYNAQGQSLGFFATRAEAEAEGRRTAGPGQDVTIAFSNTPYREFSGFEDRMPVVTLAETIPEPVLRRAFELMGATLDPRDVSSERARYELRNGLERQNLGLILPLINAVPELFTAETVEQYQRFEQNPESFPPTPGRPQGQSGAVLSEPLHGAGTPVPQQPIASTTAPPPTGQAPSVQGGLAAPVGGGTQAPATTPSARESLEGTITQEGDRFVVRAPGGEVVIRAASLDEARTFAIDNNLPIREDTLVNRAIERVEREAPAPGEEREMVSPTVRGGNLFWQDPDTGTPGTIVNPPAPPPTEEPAGGAPGTPPTGEAPPTGEVPPATAEGTLPPEEAPTQLSTELIVEGMLQGVDESVRRLIGEMTEQFGATLEAFERGQEVNEEELNARFEELKQKNINPYFKQLITNYQTDLLHNLGTLTGQRRLELEAQTTQFQEQTRNAKLALEASGMTFSGEALRLLGAESAFGQRQLPEGMEQRAPESLQMEEIPEGQIPQSQRLMATSTRARQAERLREMATGAERFLGSQQIPEAFRLAGMFTPEGEPSPTAGLTGGQIGEVERQRRAEELASLEALRGVQGATRRVNSLGQPL